MNKSTCASSGDFDLGGILPFSHRDIVEDEKFFLAVSTDEPTSIDPLELGGERILRLLAAVGTGEHKAFSSRQYPMQEKKPLNDTSVLSGPPVSEDHKSGTKR